MAQTIGDQGKKYSIREENQHTRGDSLADCTDRERQEWGDMFV